MHMTTCMLLQTLHEFWAQTGVACWLEGHAHQAPETPYLLYTAGRGDFGEMTGAAATAWFSGTDAAKRRAGIAERIDRMIPPEGVKIMTEGGMVLIERDQERFMEMTGNETDSALLGIQIRVTMRVYG